MRNHHFTATELASITTLTQAIATLVAFFGEPIDTSDLTYAMERGELALLTREGRTIETVVASFAGGWCKCSGDVVFTMPRLMDGYNNAHAPRPLRLSDAIDIHGQSCIYVSRDNGKLKAFFA